jgi:hypothetical protein
MAMQIAAGAAMHTECPPYTPPYPSEGSCRKEDERRENAMECSGSTMQEPYEDVLAVASLAGSRKQLQRWKVETQMVAGTNSVREGEQQAAAAYSGRQRRRVGMPAVSGCLVLCARCTDLANEDWLHASQ